MLPKPNISLDEFLIDPTLDDILEPPRQVLLRSTGEVEVLKPLAYWEAAPTEALHIAAVAPVSNTTSGFTWIYGSMIAGGAIVLLGIILAGAVVLRSSFATTPQAVVSEPVTEIEPVKQTRAELPAADAPSQEVHAATPPTIADQPAVEEIVVASDKPISPDAEVRSKPPAQMPLAKTAARTASLPRSKPADRKGSTFVPNKTVIYVENGQVKKRVEPQSNPKK